MHLSYHLLPLLWTRSQQIHLRLVCIVFKNHETLQLADSDFDRSAPVDILLSVRTLLDVTPAEPAYWKGKSRAWLSSLGWVLVGDVVVTSLQSLVSLNVDLLMDSLNHTMPAFWESEEVYFYEYVEKLFQDTTYLLGFAKYGV